MDNSFDAASALENGVFETQNQRIQDARRVNGEIGASNSDGPSGENPIWSSWAHMLTHSDVKILAQIQNRVRLPSILDGTRRLTFA
jgi:hypothetical protein